jgi:drug/metabolite transporter (DMT)-like permease
MPTFVLVVIVTLCTIFSQLILKRGVGQLLEVLKEAGRIEFVMSAATSPYVIAALALQGVGYVVWLFVLTQERLSVAFAMSGSFFYILMAAASWVFYDERLSLGQWAGLFIISIGILMVNLLKT